MRAAEGAIVEEAAVLAGEGNALGDALINDVHADLREAIDVGFAGAEIAAFYGVVEEAVHGVAIVVIVLRGVDAALRGDGVGAAGRILKAEAVDVIAEFTEAGGGSGAGEAGAYDEDFVFAFVGGIDELELEFVIVPGIFDGAAGGVGF